MFSARSRHSGHHPWTSARQLHCTLWVVCIICFCGFFHLGELVATSQQDHNLLFFSNVAINNRTSPSILEIYLRHSKTNRFGSGVSILLGRSFNDLCLVSALLAYITVRGGVDGPLFCHPDGNPLTKKNQVISKVCLALDMLGLSSSSYAGHNFKIGAATTAAERGLEDSIIKMLGR